MDSLRIESIVRKVVQGILESREIPRVLILSKKDKGVARNLEDFLPKDTVPVWMDEVDKTVLQSPGDRFSEIVLPFLSIKAMADLAHGRPAGRISGIVLNLLLKGHPVKVMQFEYLGYKKTAPHALWQLFSGYEKTLAGFGLKRLKEKNEKLTRVRASLICEAEMKQMADSGVEKVMISPSTRITGLARDLAKERDIEIIREDKGV